MKTKDEIREELAEKIDGALTEDCHSEICQAAYNIADLILSEHCLALLAPLYCLDEEKAKYAIQDGELHWDDNLYQKEFEECQRDGTYYSPICRRREEAVKAMLKTPNLIKPKGE